MVSIAPTILRDVYLTLRENVNAANYESVEGAFAAWMAPQTSTSSTWQLPAGFSVMNYYDVARLAFLMEVNTSNDHDHENLLTDGLRRIAGRPITLPDGGPASFRQDAVALFGLALGAKRIGGEVRTQVLGWMRSFLTPADKGTITWKRIFNQAALAIAGDTVDPRNLEDISGAEDIKLAFIAKGLDIFGEIEPDATYQEICSSTTIQEAEPVIAACRLVALEFLAKSSPALSIIRPTILQVLDLLDRVPSGLKRWPWEEKPKTTTSSIQKWDIQNEYHVQSLVYAMLAPIFPDIEDEFYFEPVGPLNSRADIGIPSLNLIIEIKFLRSNGSFKDIIEEVAADASLYFKKDSVFKKKYSQMIVFLWDNSSRNQHHHEFKQGVISIVNIVGAVVVSRPGNMVVAANARPLERPVNETSIKKKP